MTRLISIIIMSLLTSGLINAQSITPSQILAKTVGLISGSKGVEANFKIYNSGFSGSGTIKSAQSKFRVTLPDVEVWYNGKDMYTLNKRTNETTIIKPSAEELAESNPLAYVTSAQKNYNVAFSTVKKTGKYVLELTPKTKSGEIKRVTLTVRSKDYVPEKIVVEPKSGAPVSADISSFKTAVSIPAADFEYPKAKYPKVEVIDLR